MSPRSRVQWLIALSFLTVAVGLGCAAALPFATVRAWLDQHAGDGSAEPYTPEVHQRLHVAFVAGCAVCALLAGAAFFSRNSAGGHAIRRDLSNLAYRGRALAHGLCVSLALVTLLAAGLRLPFLGQPMRFDESYTFLNYASRPLVVLLARYDDPNNHVFHSALVHATTRLLGEAPWAIRLPAFVAGVLIAPLTMLLARMAGGPTAAWLAGLLTAASSPLIEFSTNARGYTLLALWTVLAWLLAASLVRRECRLGWRLLGCVVALGGWTIPVMVYPASMLFVWIAWNSVRAGRPRRRELLEGLATTIALAAGLAVLAYLPILLVSGTGSLIGNRYVAPLTWWDYLRGSPAAVIEAYRLLMRDVAPPGIAALAAGLVYAVVRRRVLGPAVATVAVCLVLTAIQRVHPPPRVWLFLVPLGIVVASVGFAQVSTSSDRRLRKTVFALLVLLTVVWPVATSFRSDSIRRSGETGVCPDARRIVEELAPSLAPGEPILAIAPVSSPLVYYADRKGVPRNHFAPLDRREDPIGPAVVVVSRVHEQSLQDVLTELRAPAELQPEEFREAGRFPSALVYRRDGEINR